MYWLFNLVTLASPVVSDDDDIVVEMTASWSWRWPDSGQSGWSDLAPGP